MRDRTQARSLPIEGGDIKIHFRFVKSVIKMSFLGSLGNYDKNRFSSLCVTV